MTTYECTNNEGREDPLPPKVGYHSLDYCSIYIKPSQCEDRQAFDDDGTYKCSTCDEYLKVSKDYMSCVEPTCLPDNRIDITGECVKCLDYKIVSNDHRECVDPDCEADDIVNKQGECVPCDQGKFVSEDKKHCLDRKCEQNEKLNHETLECIRCPDF